MNCLHTIYCRLAPPGATQDSTHNLLTRTQRYWTGTMDKCSHQDILTSTAREVHRLWGFGTIRWWPRIRRRWKLMHMMTNLNTGHTSTRTSIRPVLYKKSLRATPPLRKTTRNARWFRMRSIMRWRDTRTAWTSRWSSKWSRTVGRHTRLCPLFWIEILLFEIILNRCRG